MSKIKFDSPSKRTLFVVVSSEITLLQFLQTCTVPSLTSAQEIIINEAISKIHL